MKKTAIQVRHRTLDCEQVEVEQMEEALFQPFDNNLVVTTSKYIDGE